MTRDDILRMAREAGFKVEISALDGRPFINDLTPTQGHNAAASDGYKPRMIQACLERFATLVAAAKREECAKVCDQQVTGCDAAADLARLACASAIRARGSQ